MRASFSNLPKGAQPRVLWTVPGEACGAIGPSGFYHAPAEGPTPRTIRIRAAAEVEGRPPIQSEVLVFLEAVSVETKPSADRVAVAETIQLQAAVEGTRDQRVRWSVDGGEAAGSITPGGLYTAPSSFLTPGTVTVRATAVADPSKQATTTLRLTAVSLEVRLKEVTLRHGDLKKFEARVRGTPHTGVTWKVLGEGMGEVSPSGIYSTPATMATPAVVTLVATSVADPSKAASARVRILPVILTSGNEGGGKGGKRRSLVGTASRVMRSALRKVTRIYIPFNPIDMFVQGPVFRGRSGKQYVPLGGGVPLAAFVRNTSNDRVRWEIEGPRIGELSPDGYYEAPASMTTPAVVQIRATSEADPTKSLVHTLNIAPVVVRSEQEQAMCLLDGAIQLRAQVENSEDDRILWSLEGGERFGTVSETGLYQPPASMSTPAVVRVRATSAADPTKYAAIQVEIPEVRLELSPSETELRPGEIVRLRPRVRGCMGNAEIAWTLTPPAGVITPDGVYRAPESDAVQVVQVTATLKADPTKSAVATLRLRGRPPTAMR